MATKAQLQTLVATNLASGSSIQATAHREVENGLIDEIFGSEILDTHLTTNVFTNLLTGLEYSVVIFKQGGNVCVSGFILNNTGLIISDENLIQVTNPAYTRSANPDINYFIPTNISLLELNRTNRIKLIDSLGVGETIYFNFNYKTNE